MRRMSSCLGVLIAASALGLAAEVEAKGFGGRGFSGAGGGGFGGRAIGGRAIGFGRGGLARGNFGRGGFGRGGFLSNEGRFGSGNGFGRGYGLGRGKGFGGDFGGYGGGFYGGGFGYANAGYGYPYGAQPNYGGGGPAVIEPQGIPVAVGIREAPVRPPVIYVIGRPTAGAARRTRVRSSGGPVMAGSDVGHFVSVR